jgi:tellurite resistance protein TerC
MTDIPTITPFVWYATLALIGGLLAFDFFVHVRKAHVPTLREATLWSGIYIALALLFGVGVLAFGGSEMGQEYFAGYVTEKALSVDNLFVFLVIFASFRVPREDQQKALLFGIVFSLVARGAFIAIGAALIETFSWVFYIFGLILLFTAGHLLSPQDEDEDRADNIMIRLARRLFHTSPHYDGDRLFTMVDGRRVMTPMLLVMAAIAGSDILFALDSIPAIFGLTESAYVVFTATAFSLMGLRQLYFLIDGLLDRLVYLSYGLAAILGFIGVKLVLHALHENTLPFINEGQPVNVVEISTGLSLSVICAVLVVTVLASIFSPRGKALAAINNARRYATEYLGLDPQADPAGREEAYARMVAAEQDLERIEPRYRAMIKDPEGLAATLRQAHSQHDRLGG